jgi:hypothetical protein
MYEPIAYTYEADVHCPSCAETRFGRDDDGWIASGVVDAEGNEPGAIAPWDEWQDGTDEPQTLACGTCGCVIEEYDPS